MTDVIDVSQMLAHKWEPGRRYRYMLGIDGQGLYLIRGANTWLSPECINREGYMYIDLDNGSLPGSAKMMFDWYLTPIARVCEIIVMDPIGAPVRRHVLKIVPQRFDLEAATQFDDGFPHCNGMWCWVEHVAVQEDM